MKIRLKKDSPDSCGARLVEVMPSDFSVLAEYSRILWRAAYEPDLFSADISELLWARSYSMAALEAAYAVGEKTFWVMVNGQRAGFVAYRNEKAGPRMRLSKLYLHPSFWGQGLGAWVLQSVTRAALDVGAACIELYVFRRNVRAIQAYQRAGFKVAREELTDLGGGVVYDDFVMAKEIESPKAV